LAGTTAIRFSTAARTRAAAIRTQSAPDAVIVFTCQTARRTEPLAQSPQRRPRASGHPVTHALAKAGDRAFSDYWVPARARYARSGRDDIKSGCSSAHSRASGNPEPRAENVALGPRLRGDERMWRNPRRSICISISPHHSPNTFPLRGSLTGALLILLPSARPGEGVGGAP